MREWGGKDADTKFRGTPNTRMKNLEYRSEVSNVASLSSIVSLRPFAGKHSVLLCYYGYPLCACCQLSRLEMA